MWSVILTIMGVVSLCGAVYLVFRFHRFSFIQKLAEKNKPLSWLASCAPVALCAVFFVYNVFTVAVVLVHLVLFSLLCDLVFFLVGKLRKSKIRYDIKGFVALGLTVVYLGAGFFGAYHVFRTGYEMKTDKDVQFRVAFIGDSHLGVTLDGERFAEQMERISAEKPDVVAVVGDFVDDDSTRADMIAACAALGKIDATYGVYFVFGNHDEGYFRYRDYTGQELRAELQKNGVTVLEDESVLVDGKFYIVGRKDRSVRNRKSIDELLEGLDKTKFTLVLDHQPNDYANEAGAGADLVLSGHTHGGHIFPAGLVGLMIGANDKVYGMEKRDGTTFIVTSGISGWALPIKTGTASEYVVVDVHS